MVRVGVSLWALGLIIVRIMVLFDRQHTDHVIRHPWAIITVLHHTAKCRDGFHTQPNSPAHLSSTYETQLRPVCVHLKLSPIFTNIKPRPIHSITLARTIIEIIVRPFRFPLFPPTPAAFTISEFSAFAPLDFESSIFTNRHRIFHKATNNATTFRSPSAH